jgi:hypothetical protein
MRSYAVLVLLFVAVSLVAAQKSPDEIKAFLQNTLKSNTDYFTNGTHYLFIFNSVDDGWTYVGEDSGVKTWKMAQSG